MDHDLSVAGSDPKSGLKPIRIDDFPQCPGEGFLQHAAAVFRETAESRLANAGLLAIAQGHDPYAVTSIKDTDMSSIPTLPPTHSHSQAEAAAQSLLRQQGQQHSLQESLDQRREAALAYRAQRPLSGV